MQKPCPASCTCSYDTINCNELIERCDECVHWSQIDFNQIRELRPNSFAHFRFAPHRLTHIIIYKLLNSSIGAHAFANMHTPVNAHVEITFQYNSLVRFEAQALAHASLAANSTLVFNFPYTTQVVFMARCFDAVRMLDSRARLILRILKSFSVRFAGHHYAPRVFNLRRRRRRMTSEALVAANNSSNSGSGSKWSLANGQLIVDIKSTHLVKFEEDALAHMRMSGGARLYVDMELVEKLVVHARSFGNVSVEEASRVYFYAKQVNLLDVRSLAFGDVRVTKDSRVQLYMEELSAAWCVPRDTFARLRLEGAGASFNLSVINSKSVQMMRDAFSDVRVVGEQARLFVGVFNVPSWMLLHAERGQYYEEFVRQRVGYLWPTRRDIDVAAQQDHANAVFG